MKRIIAYCAVICLLLCGCAANTTDSAIGSDSGKAELIDIAPAEGAPAEGAPAEGAPANGTSANSSSANGGSTSNSSKGDRGKRGSATGSASASSLSAPASNADGQSIYGRVSSIIGNEVVLELGEAVNVPESISGGTPSGKATGAATEPSFAGAPSAEPPSAGAEPPSAGAEPPSTGGAGVPSAGAPSAGGGKGGSDSGSRSSRTVELEYSGETATYLLPVGMSIGSGDFSSVTEGSILKLSINSEGTITAVSMYS